MGREQSSKPGNLAGESAKPREVCAAWGDPQDPYNADADHARRRGWLDEAGYVTAAGTAELESRNQSGHKLAPRPVKKR